MGGGASGTVAVVVVSLIADVMSAHCYSQKITNPETGDDYSPS